MFEKFLINLAAEAVKNPDTREFLLEFADRIGNGLFIKLSALIPLSAASVLKRLGDAAGIDVPESLNELTDVVRNEVNEALPNGVDIPILSDAFRKFTGFDLSDLIMGRKPNG